MALETPIWLQGGTYSARLDRSLLDVIFTEGVVDPGGSALLVAQRAAGANDSVDIAAGAAIIAGDDEANQGKYYVRHTAVSNVVFTPAPGSDSRIDLLVLQVNDPTAGGSAGDNATFVVVEGSVAGSPVPPAVPDTAIPLAEVLRTATDTSITDAMITDRRVASSAQQYTTNSQFEILTTTERNALTPFAGQTIFNSTDEVVQYYDGTQWVSIEPPLDPIPLILALS
jgi:alkanesulfonate monooxygenase SsuD/methylene tetrahydromethanopterin reductase-like flavin-dependent oxidoreductase (luciferase family)